MSEDTVGLQEDSEGDESPNTYECVDCGYRTEAMAQPGDCPECGGHMQNADESDGD